MYLLIPPRVKTHDSLSGAVEAVSALILLITIYAILEASFLAKAV